MPSEEVSQFLAVLAFEQMSALELASVRSANIYDFEITDVGKNAALIECTLGTAKKLAKRLGGTYKIAAICGTSIDGLLNKLMLPERPKFNWTVSGYQCDSELLTDLRIQVQSFLKSKTLGKSRFLEPTIGSRAVSSQKAGFQFSELNIKELAERIVSPNDNTPQGLDVVVHGGLGGHFLFGYTIATSDVIGFEHRDFSRSYQDPTMTVSPRLARIMVNMAMNSRRGTLMDPFCGLGTILQEALMCGYNAIGMDLSEANIHKTRTNLGWLFREYQLSPKLGFSLKRGDSIKGHERLGSTDGIATEPILMPKFEKNPSTEVASKLIRSVRQTYEMWFLAMRNLPRTSKIAITSPALIDDAGRIHTFEMQEICKKAGFAMYRPDTEHFVPEYPFRVPTSKKKIVQRDLHVMMKD